MFFAANALAMQRIREATTPKVVQKKILTLRKVVSYNQTTFTRSGKPIFICNSCGNKSIGKPPTCEHFEPV